MSIIYEIKLLRKRVKFLMNVFKIKNPSWDGLILFVAVWTGLFAVAQGLANSSFFRI
jgi:hypothetical protein